MRWNTRSRRKIESGDENEQKWQVFSLDACTRDAIIFLVALQAGSIAIIESYMVLPCVLTCESTLSVGQRITCRSLAIAPTQHILLFHPQNTRRASTELYAQRTPTSQPNLLCKDNWFCDLGCFYTRVCGPSCFVACHSEQLISHATVWRQLYLNQQLPSTHHKRWWKET